MKVKITINGQTFEKDVDDSGNVTINMGETVPKCDSHKERQYFTRLGDRIEREITYNDSGDIVDIKDRNISREERLEIKRLNRIKRDLEIKNAPLYAKIIAFLFIFWIPIMFLILWLLEKFNLV